MPLTTDCPKPLLKVGGLPIIEQIIRKAKAEGFHDITISVNYLKEMIKEYIGNGDKLGVNIKYIEESKPLGTAGCLSEFVPNKRNIVVTNGDVITDLSFDELCKYHEQNKAFGTMAVKNYEWASPYGVVETEGLNIREFKEKPIYHSYVNAGIYVLDHKAVDLLNKGEYCDMPTLFEMIKTTNKKTIVYPMHEPWIDVGRPSELEKARNNSTAI